MNPPTIQGRELTDADKGSKVTYVPRHARGNADHPDADPGRIMYWNSSGVMVDYGYNKSLTPPENLVWG